jgi:Ankyrin repeats (3 copies)
MPRLRLSSGPSSPDTEPRRRLSPAGHSSLETVQLLAQVYRRAVRQPGTGGRLPLHDAAKRNSLKTVRHLARKYPKAAEQATKEGRFPLHLAARYNSPEVVRYLAAEHPEAAREKMSMGWCVEKTILKDYPWKPKKAARGESRSSGLGRRPPHHPPHNAPHPPPRQRGSVGSLIDRSIDRSTRVVCCHIQARRCESSPTAYGHDWSGSLEIKVTA